MKKEDDISVEVLASPGEIKTHLPLYCQIHQILCVKSTKKTQKPKNHKTPTQTNQKAEKQNNSFMLYPIKDHLTEQLGSSKIHL